MTLSIGVGRLAATLREGEAMAVQALDMALGRGGDQAAVKSAEGFEFYGGVSRSVEKRSKVKSRIIASAIKDLMAQSESARASRQTSLRNSAALAAGMILSNRTKRKNALIKTRCW